MIKDDQSPRLEAIPRGGFHTEGKTIIQVVKCDDLA